MKKAELEKIMSAESTAWEKLCERDRAAWNALHDLCVSLGIKESHSDYAFECQTNFWRYATNK